MERRRVQHMVRDLKRKVFCECGKEYIYFYNHEIIRLQISLVTQSFQYQASYVLKVFFNSFSRKNL